MVPMAGGPVDLPKVPIVSQARRIRQGRHGQDQSLERSTESRRGVELVHTRRVYSILGTPGLGHALLS